jgi:predicted RNA-binding Zn-ribbon protein involved in translation (DUF1610 family)
MTRGGSNVLGGRLNELLLSPRAVCPDCGERVPWRSVRATLTIRGVEFCECPRCGVGSPKREWKVKRGRNAKDEPDGHST